MNVCCSAAPQAILRLVKKEKEWAFQPSRFVFPGSLEPVIIWGSCLLCNQWIGVFNEGIWVWETTSNNVLNIAACFCLFSTLPLLISLLSRVFHFAPKSSEGKNHAPSLSCSSSSFCCDVPPWLDSASACPVNGNVIHSANARTYRWLRVWTECFTHTHTPCANIVPELLNGTKCSKVTRTVRFLFSARTSFILFRRNFVWANITTLKIKVVRVCSVRCENLANNENFVPCGKFSVCTWQKSKSWQVRKNVSVAFFFFFHREW